MGVGLGRENLVQVSEISQFVYCPRRFYYITFLDTIGKNYELTDGRLSHEGISRRGGWTREMYLISERYGLRGKIDIVEEGETLTPIERKRAESGKYFESDELQLTAYCMLLEDNIDGKVNVGYIYTESNDKRHIVRITGWHREQVKKIISTIQEMTIDNIPPFTDNRNKCVKCSTRGYCMPEESRMLGEA